MLIKVRYRVTIVVVKEHQEIIVSKGKALAITNT